jgi:hypothetical protein
VSPFNINTPSLNKVLPYEVKVTIAQPREFLPEYPRKLPDGPKETPVPHEGGIVPRLGKLFPHQNREEEVKDPWIPNTQTSVKNELFLSDDIAVIYIDGCRFLPENTSFTRFRLTGRTDTATLSLKDSIAFAKVAESTIQFPKVYH